MAQASLASVKPSVQTLLSPPKEKKKKKKKRQALNF
jgi:hypothetical protein